MKNIIIIVLVLIGITIAGNHSYALINESYVDSLIKQESKSKIKTSKELYRLNNSIANDVFVKLKSQSDNRSFDKEYGNKTHQYIEFLTRQRYSDASVFYNQHINFRLDYPDYAKINPATIYPFAYALAQLGTYDIVHLMLEAIRLKNHEDTHLNIWVLIEICGQERADQLLEDEMRRAKTPEEKKRLKAAIGFQINWQKLTSEKQPEKNKK